MGALCVKVPLTGGVPERVLGGWWLEKYRGWGVVVSNPYGGPYPKCGVWGSDRVF